LLAGDVFPDLNYKDADSDPSPAAQDSGFQKYGGGVGVELKHGIENTQLIDFATR
jgi:hypothetical protein